MLGTGVAGTILRHLVQAAARLFRVTATRGVTIAIADRRCYASANIFVVTVPFMIPSGCISIAAGTAAAACATAAATTVVVSVHRRMVFVGIITSIIAS